MFRRLIYLTAAALPLLLAASESPFVWTAAASGEQITATVEIEPGSYLDWNSIGFEITGAAGSAPVMTSAPTPAAHTDPLTGDPGLILPAGTHRWQWQGTPPFALTAAFQGCRNAGAGGPSVCLLPEELQLWPPQTAPLARLETDFELLPERLSGLRLAAKAEGWMDADAFAAFLDRRTPAPEAGSGGLAGLGFLTLMLVVLAGGVGLNLTPCVLPMIPVNLAIIGAGAPRRQGWLRGLAYGFGMAAAYGVLGAAVILAGARFGELNSSSWFNFAVAVVFLILAAAMLGWINLDFSGRFDLKPSRIRGGALLVAFIMGAVAALLAGACVAPVVISVLIFAAERYQSGAAAALFLPLLLGIGMGLPWPLAGAGLSVLPKPGRFMVAVKYLFAALIAAAALYYAWTGFTLLPGRYSVPAELARLGAAMENAAVNRKPLLIDFWATWCKNCAAMERSVLTAPEVRERLNRFTVVKFQAEKLSDPTVRALLDRFGISGLPAFVILTPAENP